MELGLTRPAAPAPSRTATSVRRRAASLVFFALVFFALGSLRLFVGDVRVAGAFFRAGAEADWSGVPASSCATSFFGATAR